MLHRTSTEESFATAPRHLKVRRRPWRRARCSCGLRWPCQDRILLDLASRPQPDAAVPAWSAEPTRAYPQVGRAGLLTPGQAHRSNGGRY